MNESPEAVRDKLLAKLVARNSKVLLYEQYFMGNHPLSFAAKKYRQAFGDQLHAFASNWTKIVIDVPVERLNVEGFRYSDQAIADKAWEIWNANNLSSTSIMAHVEASKHGDSYVLVAPGEDGTPIITIEHPLNMAVCCSDENSRDIEYAIRFWTDDDKNAFATLYTPDTIYKWASAEPTSNGSKVKWIVREEPADNPMGVVPVVQLENNPSLIYGGVSDLTDVIPLNDGINKLMCDLLVASEFYAFPQRVITGLEEMVDQNGNPIPVDKIPGHLAQTWLLPEGASITQLKANDLAAYSNAIQEFLKQIASITRTPPNYLLLGQMVNVSGDALQAAEKGLTSKVRRKQKDFGDSWQDVIVLAFIASGDAASAKAVPEVIWAEAESRTLAQIVDPIVKMRQVLGVPLEACWEYLGATPEQIQSWKVLAGLPDRAPPGGTFDTPASTDQSQTSTTDPSASNLQARTASDPNLPNSADNAGSN